MNNIAVIGAGPMGLAVAYHLLKSGNRVKIYEAGDVVGGMTASFNFEGLKIERYYHFICSSDKPLFDLLSELGIKNKLYWRNTKMGFYYNGQLYEWGNPIALFKFPKLGFISKLRYGLMAFTSTKRKDWKKLDKIDAITWIKKWVGGKAYQILWQPLFELKFYQYTNNLSAAWIWTRIRRIGNSRKNMMVECMGYMDEGSEIIVDTLKDKIEAMGGKVFVSSPVEKILIENNQVTGIQRKGEKESFDQVVSTIPTPYISRLVPDLPQLVLKQFNALENIAVVCIIVKLKKALTDNFWLNINDPRMDIPGIIEYSNLNPLSEHVVYVPYYMPSNELKYQDSDDVYFEKVRNYLQMINADIGDDDILSMHASRYLHAQPICEPEFLSKLPPIQLPVKNLYVADTSYYYPEDRSISESVKLGKIIAEMLGKQ